MIYRRTIVREIEKYFPEDNVVVLHGARQVGKTSLLYYLKDSCARQGRQVHYIDLEDSRYLALLDAGVDSFLRHLKEEGLDLSRRAFVFIDEIQYLENPSSFLKLVADHHKEVKLVVSGSSSFAIKSKFRDSLAGRTADFEIQGLSFKEFLLFKGCPVPEDFAALTGKKTEELRSLYTEFALYGGYPRVALTAAREMKESYLQQIVDTYLRKDIRDLAAVRDIGKFNKLLEVLASQSGQLLNVAELSSTCGIAQQTVERYLFILEQTYVLRLLKPFSGSLRSELFKTPKIFFFDTGLMQMLWLKCLPGDIIGSVFETSVFSELAKALPAEELFHWRTKDKKEIDFVVRARGRPFPIEAKLNFEAFRPSAVRAFKAKYRLREHLVVGLRGKPADAASVYPWALPGLACRLAAPLSARS